MSWSIINNDLLLQVMIINQNDHNPVYVNTATTKWNLCLLICQQQHPVLLLRPEYIVLYSSVAWPSFSTAYKNVTQCVDNTWLSHVIIIIVEKSVENICALTKLYNLVGLLYLKLHDIVGAISWCLYSGVFIFKNVYWYRVIYKCVYLR